MPASSCNFLVVYPQISQVYSASSKDVALQSPPPVGLTLEDKEVLFITVEPDTRKVIVRQLPKEEVLNATIKEPKPKKKLSDEQD